MALLEVNHLVKNFGPTQVLRDVSFSLEAGQVLALIGSSGSGKTTLLRCLTGLENPDSGAIVLQGGGSFGLVFQNFNLFPQYTALENITLPPCRNVRRSAAAGSHCPGSGPETGSSLLR